jgi:hypothetical protein
MIDPVMTLYNHVKRNPLHLAKSLATIQKHRDAGRFDPDLALRLLRNNVTDNVRAMPNERFTIHDCNRVALMILADSAPRTPENPYRLRDTSPDETRLALHAKHGKLPS